MTQVLDKDAILTCESKHSVFNGLMKDLGLDEIAKTLNVSYQHVRRLATKGNIRALVRQEKAKIDAKIAKKLEITREGQARKGQEAYDMAVKQENVQGMVAALKSQSVLFGLEKQVIEQSEAQRQLSEAQALEARKLADIRLREDMSNRAGKVLQNGTEEPETHDYAMDWTDDKPDQNNTGTDQICR